MENRYREYNITKTFDVEKLVTVHFFEFDKHYEEFTETHDFWEMVYVDMGEIVVIGGSEEFTLRQGEICFHKPHERHGLRGTGNSAANIFIISFVCHSPDMRLFCEKRGALPAELAHYIPALLQDACQTFELPFNDPSMEMLKKRSDAVFGGEQCIVNRLELFLIDLARKESHYDVHPLVSKVQVKDELVLKVISILEENIYQRITMKTIVEDMNYSETYIARRFKAVCGQSIMSYYLQLRINESKKLIRETEKNFTEIAGLLGFSDSQHFTKTFKRYVRMSPKEYLKSVRPYYMRRNKVTSEGEDSPIV